MSIETLLLPLAYFAIIIWVTWLAARLMGAVIRRVMMRSTPLVASLAQRLVWLLIWLVGAILAIQQLGINSDILLLIVGLLGAGMIVAAREGLENVGAKYFADLYIPFKVGDSIKVRDNAGTVIEVNSMSTILLTEDNRLVSIPNSVFIKEAIINTTPQAWKEVTIPVTIGNDVDFAAFESAILKSLGKLKLHLDKRFPPVLTIKSRSQQSTELILTVMIRRPEQRDAIVAEVNKRVAETIEAMQGSKK